MRSFTVALLLVGLCACSAFAPVSRTAKSAVPKIALSMAATEEVEDIATPTILPDAEDQPKKNLVKNIPKGGKVTEVKWTDDAPTANVDFAMSWGYIFVVLPGVLFLNDIFHVVPKGTWGIF